MEALSRLSRFCKGLLLAFLQGVERKASYQRVVTGLVIALIFTAALYLRIHFYQGVVFGGTWVKYTGVDAYWHMRIIDNLAHNFPHLSFLDPYMLYPGGGGTSSTNGFFDYLLAGIIWVIGLGSPTDHTVDMVAPYFPPVLGALTIVPAYVIGKTLFSRWAGLVAAVLVAIVPGEFLGRSMLGFTDHHVVETLFTTTAVMFVILALKTARKERMTWSDLRHPKTSSIAKPLIYALLGGLFLGMYLASWMGALLFVFILAVFFLIQFCVDHLRKVPTDYLCLVGVAVFLPALLMFLLVGEGRNTVAVLAIATLIPLALFAISRLMSNRGPSWLHYSYPIAVVGLGLAAFGILYAIWPSLVNPMLDNMEIFRWNKGTTVAEMVPFLYQRISENEGYFSLDILWQLYGFSIVFGTIALCLLGYAVIKRWEPGKVLLIIWTVVILLATLAQRRFNYYLIVNVALLSGYLSWEILRLAGLRQLASERGVELDGGKRLRKPKGKKQSQEPSYRLRSSHAYVALTAIAIFSLFTIVPYTRQDLYGTGTPRLVSTIDYAKAAVSQSRYSPPDAWCESLTWMRDNTPEPFDDPEFYYARYDAPFDYSKYPNAYGVMAWWDYGYWIVRIGHRPPSQNPGGAIPAVAEFFVAQNESDGQRVMDERGARYVILDFDFVTGKLYGAVNITGKTLGDFYDTFWVQTSDGGWQATTFFLPAYYQSMSVRLYNFGGKAVTPGPGDCKVLEWAWKEREGVWEKRVTDTTPFDTYEAALAFVNSRKSGNYSIASNNPFISPVALEELKGFTLCHDSEAREQWSSNSGDTIPQVRIFEYVK